MCDNHHPVPCRTLYYEMIPDIYPWLPGHMVRVTNGRGEQVTAGHTDGLGCPACGSFEPNEYSRP